MDKEQEWLTSLIKENTKLHHTTSMVYLKEFLGKTPEEILEMRQEEGKRFNTRMVMFWKWLQDKKGLSESTSSSYVFGTAGFFSYYDLDLKLKGKIPDTKMKIETYQPNIEDIQRIFRLGDLQIKTLLGAMRDVPCRVGDLVKKVIPRLKEKEFLIESEKESIVGKCYLSPETSELYNQLEEAGLTLPTTKRGISKMLERACNVAGVIVWNPHILRKYFFTTASNLNINRDILRVLMFKSVSKDVLTYLLNREELRISWQQIVNAIPLENRNGKITNVEKELSELKQALHIIWKYTNTPSETGSLYSMMEPAERIILEKILEEKE